MNKFIGKAEKKPVKRTTKKIVKKETPKTKEVVEVIKKGVQEFVICPKCGWQHGYGTKKCRFCGKKIGE